LSAEAKEGRGLQEENMFGTNISQTLRWAGRIRNRPEMPNGLERVRQAARKDRSTRFTALFHHITPELLRKCFQTINPRAVPGVDGVDYYLYGNDIVNNSEDLHQRLQRGAYKALPSRMTYIPKADGKMGPLGIAALEDKIVQRAVVEVLSAICEVDFKDYSYGFRTNRGCHNALDKLYLDITICKVSWIVDADIKSFFDSLSHDWLISVLEHRTILTDGYSGCSSYGLRPE
jgi:hypothetical protein